MDRVLFWKGVVCVQYMKSAPFFLIVSATNVERRALLALIVVSTPAEQWT